MLLDANKNIKIVDFGLSNTYLQTSVPGKEILLIDANSSIDKEGRLTSLREGQEMWVKE